MKRTGIRAVSAKRRVQNRIRRGLADEIGRHRCMIGSPVCTGWAEHWHELVGSGTGGSRTDERNLVPCCDACNGGPCENDPRRYEFGWKVRVVDAMQGDGGLVPKRLSPLCLAALRSSMVEDHLF